MKKKLVCLILSCMLVICSVSSGAFAAGKAPHSTEKDSGNWSSLIAKLPTEKNVKVQKSLSVQSNFLKIAVPKKQFNVQEASSEVINIPGSVYHNDSTLTSSEDVYRFKTTADHSLFLKMKSDNTNYAVLLFMIKDSGLINTEFYDQANDDLPSALLDLPAGDYALAVFSLDGSFGQSYTVALNDSNPANFTDFKIATPNLSACVVVKNGILYSNGINIETQSFEWERKIDVADSRITHIEDQQIFHTNVTSLTWAFNYESSSAKSDLVLLEEIGPGTGWSYNIFDLDNQTGYASATGIDVSGMETPRNLTKYDIDNYPYPYFEKESGKQHLLFCLVYDLSTNQYIDFVSGLNRYYYYNSESVKNIDFD